MLLNVYQFTSPFLVPQVVRMGRWFFDAAMVWIHPDVNQIYSSFSSITLRKLLYFCSICILCSLYYLNFLDYWQSNYSTSFLLEQSTAIPCLFCICILLLGCTRPPFMASKCVPSSSNQSMPYIFEHVISTLFENDHALLITAVHMSLLALATILPRTDVLPTWRTRLNVFCKFYVSWHSNTHKHTHTHTLTKFTNNC